MTDLSGTHPTPSPTLSGTTHPLPLSTPYYTATLPLWLDLIDDPADWAATFLTPEAKEVLDALGGLLVIFEIPAKADDDAAEGLIREVGRVVREGLGGWEWDGVVVAVGLGRDPDGEWEERCAEGGMELVVVGGGESEGARNEFGGTCSPSLLSRFTLSPVYSQHFLRGCGAVRDDRDAEGRTNRC